MGNGADDRLNSASVAREARAHGFLGEACEACGQYTLMHHGDTLRCDTCNHEQAPSTPFGGEDVEIVRSGSAETPHELPILHPADALGHH